MAVYRTARGRLIDMDKITRDRQDTIAVTGSPIVVNARGDVLGRGGKPVKPVRMRDNPEASVAHAVAHQDRASVDRKTARKAQEALRATPAEVQRMALETERREREEAAARAETAAKDHTSAIAGAPDPDADDASPEIAPSDNDMDAGSRRPKRRRRNR